jgi:sensor domain CHASE-containing protein
MEIVSFVDVFQSTHEKQEIQEIQNTQETQSFPIQVKTMTGLLHSITVKPTMTVMELKHLIEKVEHYGPDQQRIVYSGKQLSDEKQLKDYSIQADVTIHLIIRLRGGMYHESSGRKDMEVLQCTLLKEITNIEQLLAFQKINLCKFTPNCGF